MTQVLMARDDVLLVARGEAEQRSASGIIVAGGSKRSQYATVVALGPFRKSPYGDGHSDWGFAIGDQVLIAEAAIPVAAVKDSAGKDIEAFRSRDVIAYIVTAQEVPTEETEQVAQDDGPTDTQA